MADSTHDQGDREQEEKEARLRAKIRDLSRSELEHLSLSTKLDVSVEGNEHAASQLEESLSDVEKDIPEVAQGPLSASVIGKQVMDAKQQLKAKKRPAWMSMAIAAGVLLVVLVIGMGALVMWQRMQGPSAPPDLEIPTNELTNGEEQLSRYLSQEDMDVDSDGDAIPDRLEVMLATDPLKNDCIRQIGCGEFGTLPRTTLELNLVFVVDASGSMGQMFEGVRKWDSATDALGKVMGTGFPSFTNVGLVVYGHRGSSNESDKAVSCEGVEIRSPLQKWSESPVQSEIGELEPTGWTPLASALRVAGEMVRDRQGAGNFVVVLSDGTETCGGDPVAVARELHESGIEVTTNVVGLAVSEQEKLQLEEIALAGGGKYFPANSPQELQQAVYLSSEVVRLWEQINQCIVDHLSAYGSCINSQYSSALVHIKEQRQEFEEQKATIRGTGTTLPGYAELEKRLFDQWESYRVENWQQYVQDLENLRLRE